MVPRSPPKILGNTFFLCLSENSNLINRKYDLVKGRSRTILDMIVAIYVVSVLNDMYLGVAVGFGIFEIQDKI